MDATSIQCGRDTRDRLKAYKNEHEFDNYDAALNALLDQTV